VVKASTADSTVKLETHSFLIFKSITLLHTQQHISRKQRIITTVANTKVIYHTITILHSIPI